MANGIIYTEELTNNIFRSFYEGDPTAIICRELSKDMSALVHDPWFPDLIQLMDEIYKLHIITKCNNEYLYDANGTCCWIIKPHSIQAINSNVELFMNGDILIHMNDIARDPFHHNIFCNQFIIPHAIPMPRDIDETAFDALVEARKNINMLMPEFRKHGKKTLENIRESLIHSLGKILREYHLC